MPLPSSYNSVSGRSVFEERIKGSRFIAILVPCQSADDIKALISEVESEYPNATHYCYGAIIGPEMVQRHSDNGEPSGTAGKPIADALAGAGLSDVLCVVVRYFGGTLLGTGGLVRAYSDTAKGAIGGAEPVERSLCAVYTADLDYPSFNTFDRTMGRFVHRMLKRDFSDRVRLEFAVRIADSDEFDGILDSKGWLPMFGRTDEKYLRGKGLWPPEGPGL